MMPAFLRYLHDQGYRLVIWYRLLLRSRRTPTELFDAAPKRPAYRSTTERHHPSQRSRWRRLIARWQPACAFGCALADAGGGLSAAFRQVLTARGLTWAVGIPRHLKVYPLGVKLIWPVAMRGRLRRRSILDILSRPAEDMLADSKWRNVRWRSGTKRPIESPVCRASESGAPMDLGSG